jgi:hypothetical protein
MMKATRCMPVRTILDSLPSKAGHWGVSCRASQPPIKGRTLGGVV